MTTAEQSLAQNGSVLTTNSHGQSPLYLAAQNGHKVMVRYLIQRHNANIQFQSPTGLTPLAVAAREGHLEVVRLLIQLGANPNAPFNLSPLLWATRNGQADTVRELLQLGAEDPKDDPGKFWIWSLAANHSGAMQTLHEILGAQPVELPNEMLMTEDALVHSVRHRYVAMTRRYLNEPMVYPSVGQQNSTWIWNMERVSLSVGLYHAIRHGDEDMVELLLQRGAEADSIYNPVNAAVLQVTPLALALNRGFVGIAEQLLDHGANPNSGFSHPALSMLAWAVQEKLETLVFKSLRNGANPNSNSGIPPLAMAVWAQSPVMVKTLLNFRANTVVLGGFWGDDGRTAHLFERVISYARFLGNQDVVATLERYGGSDA